MGLCVERIVWSEANAHLYGGKARQAGWTEGSMALAEAEADGRQTYNFEVENFHTYGGKDQTPNNIRWKWSAK